MFLKNKLSKRSRVLTQGMVLSAVLGISGCADMGAPLIPASNASLAGNTAQSYMLRSLPVPSKKVMVGVYDFPDLTGQFKERELVQTNSRAVTQGGSTMLIKALLDTGNEQWFDVLDRSGLQDLVRERQITTEMRRLYNGETEVNPSILAPLKTADIILQGGIIGYDTNIQTGGVGARYLGVGANGDWKLDVVTVSLRAVDTNTGRVLANVMASKSIASTKVQSGVFRYIALDEILELEAGVSANEPKQVAVQQAIEKAVHALVLEGAENGVWSFADRKKGVELIARYRQEKESVPLPVSRKQEVVPAPIISDQIALNDAS
jgi:curli production assembly/transport component CsgG